MSCTISTFIHLTYCDFFRGNNKKSELELFSTFLKESLLENSHGSATKGKSL